MEEEKIIQLICGHLTDEEKQKTLKEISSSVENKEFYYKTLNAWALSSQHKTTNGIKTKDFEKFINKVRDQKTAILIRNFRLVLKYAAVIVIAFTAGRYAFKSKAPVKNVIAFNEITVPPGQMAQLTLADSTVVFINSSSKLKYPIQFTENDRKVYLSGEAYFEVRKNKKVPFIVQTNDYSVKVLGTKFNVMNYPNDRCSRTTLEVGSIILIDSSRNKELMLIPGQQYKLNRKTNKAELYTVKTEYYTSWKDGIYTFDHESLGNILERLERVYAIKIKINDSHITRYKFSGKILRSSTIEQVLKLIRLTSPIEYNIKVYDDGSKEVILSSKKQ